MWRIRAHTPVDQRQTEPPCRLFAETETKVDTQAETETKTEVEFQTEASIYSLHCHVQGTITTVQCTCALRESSERQVRDRWSVPERICTKLNWTGSAPDYIKANEHSRCVPVFLRTYLQTLLHWSRVGQPPSETKHTWSRLKIK